MIHAGKCVAHRVVAGAGVCARNVRPNRQPETRLLSISPELHQRLSAAARSRRCADGKWWGRFQATMAMRCMGSTNKLLKCSKLQLRLDWLTLVLIERVICTRGQHSTTKTPPPSSSRYPCASVTLGRSISSSYVFSSNVTGHSRGQRQDSTSRWPPFKSVPAMGCVIFSDSG